MDTANLVSLISFASILSGCGAVFFGTRGLMSRGRQDAELRRELRRLPRIRDVEPKGPVERFDVWFEQTLYSAGTNMTPLEGVLLTVMVSLSGGGAMFLATEDERFTLVAAVLCASIVFITLVIMARRRMTQFEQQFPTALDLLARAVRAGESFDQSLALVGDASQEPVSTELKRCARQLDLGLSVHDCMRGLSQRVNLMDVQIFANAVSVHRDSGGNLPITVERLAEVVRDLYRSDTQPEQSYSERQLYEAALDRMSRELAVVQKITEQESLKLIDVQLQKGPRRAAKAESEAEAGEIDEAA